MRETSDLTWGIAFTSALLLGMRLPVREDWPAIPTRIAASLLLFAAGGWVGSACGALGPFVAMGVIYVGLKVAGTLLAPTAPAAQSAGERPQVVAQLPVASSPQADSDEAAVRARGNVGRRFLYFVSLAAVVAVLEYATGRSGSEYRWRNGAVSHMFEYPVQYWTGTQWFTLTGVVAIGHWIVKSTRDSRSSR